MKNRRKILNTIALLLVLSSLFCTCVFAVGPQVIPGDMNEDSTVNLNDAIYLLRHTMMPSRYPVYQSADVNGSQNVDINDAIYLLRHTMMPSRYPILSGVHTHSLTHFKEKAASCTEDGNIEYWLCSICNKKFDADNKELTTVSIPAAHTGGTELRDQKDATEYVDGYTGDTYCLGCNEILTQGAVIPHTSNAPAIAVSNVTLNNNTVTAIISIVNNPGIVSLKFDVMYDNVLTIQSIDFSDSFGVYVTSPKPYINPQTVNWISEGSNVTTNGEFMTITFSVKPDIAGDTVANIRIIPDNSNIFNSSMTNIQFTSVGSSVTING